VYTLLLDPDEDETSWDQLGQWELGEALQNSEEAGLGIRRACSHLTLA
jgi:hypothetical protein